MILLLFFFPPFSTCLDTHGKSQGVAPMLGAGVCVSGGPRPEAPSFDADIMGI